MVAALNTLSAQVKSGAKVSYASAKGQRGKLLLVSDWTFSWASAGIYLAVVGLVVATGGAGAVALGVGIGIAGVGAAGIGVFGE